MRLPEDIDPIEFNGEFRAAVAQWAPAVAEVAARHGLAVSGFAPFADGSNLVAAIDQRWVVKIFPPFHRAQWESEHRLLAFFGTRLPVPVPRLLAAGERDNGWTYVVVSLLQGETLEGHWAMCPPDDRVAILGEIGRTMAAAHALPVGDLASLSPKWDEFLPRQLDSCAARLARQGMPDWLVSRAEAFAREALATLDGASAVLTGEYTPFNLLVGSTAAGLRLQGMIDFGDGMVGPPAYDLLGPSVFLAAGDRSLVRALMRGYAGRADAMDPRLRRTLMGLFLTHRYCNPNTQLRLPGWRNHAQSIEELERLIWPE